ncbi:MAG TPA: hypothetical protein VIJ45_00250 [Coriobacteriia bacterium]
MTTDEIGAAFVRLGLGIGQHLPGYVDAYYGPAEIARAIEDEGKASLTDLEAAAGRLAGAVAAEPALQPARREYLLGEIAAMQTTLRILQGDPPSFTEEVRRLYGVTPAWVDESTFADAHDRLADILPGTAPLSQRVPEFRERMRIPAQAAAPAIERLGAELRQRTRARFHLPPEESCEFSLVRGEPWTAYNWYVGGSASRVQFNEDHPIYIHRLPEIVAHESYPGHHTEHAIKEATLYRKEGRLEHSVLLSNTPSALVSEGIAQNALQMVAESEEIVAFFSDLLEAAGLPADEAQRVYEFTLAEHPLEKVPDNQLLLLHGEGASEDEVIGYGVRHALSTEEDERRFMAFAKEPLWRSYCYNYTLGYDIVHAFLSASTDRFQAFGRLLEEPMTPGQVVSASAPRA